VGLDFTLIVLPHLLVAVEVAQLSLVASFLELHLQRHPFSLEGFIDGVDLVLQALNLLSV